jgi:hypothetical protein
MVMANIQVLLATPKYSRRKDGLAIVQQAVS